MPGGREGQPDIDRSGIAPSEGKMVYVAVSDPAFDGSSSAKAC